LLVYWLLLGVLAFASLVYQRRYRLGADGTAEIDPGLSRQSGLFIALVAIALLVGLRYQVGGDWNGYLHLFRLMQQWPLSIALRRSPDELGYTLLNWLVVQAGGPFWLVNLGCAIPFVAGLSAFSRQQPNPWLALTVAAPLLIIVVAMGYTRQAAAMGFMLIGLTGLSGGRGYMWFFAWTLVGGLFHQSVLLFIALVPLSVFRFTPFSIPLLAIALFLGYLALEPHVVDRYSAGYIRQVYVAKGALFRIAPNAAAGMILLLFRYRFEGTKIELRFWTGLACAALLLQLLYFFIHSTVPLDRLSVYVLPLQVWVWSKIPTAFSGRRAPDLVLTILVIGYSAASLWIWLAFANHSKYWLPYQFYPMFASS
jgi:hypothetical protein